VGTNIDLNCFINPPLQGQADRVPAVVLYADT
jgi:hypothetical protein